MPSVSFTKTDAVVPENGVEVLSGHRRSALCCDNAVMHWMDKGINGLATVIPSLAHCTLAREVP